jgi:Flp pilus assembly pilin Flp
MSFELEIRHPAAFPVPENARNLPQSCLHRMVRSVPTSKPGHLHFTMINLIKHFCRNQSGAVAVNWVVIASALIGLTAAVLATATTSPNGFLRNVVATQAQNVQARD